MLFAFLVAQDGTVNVDKMTTEQKNSYLEAHMKVQQHMQQVTQQLNKQTHNHSTSQSHNHINQQQQHHHHVTGSHQSSSSHLNPYAHSNAIKVKLETLVTDVVAVSGYNLPFYLIPSRFRKLRPHPWKIHSLFPTMLAWATRVAFGYFKA